MAVPSDGSYDIPEGVIYSYPCTCTDGHYEIVQGLEINDFSREKMAATDRELREEREARAVLLAGTEQAFTAGGDFAWFPRFAEPGYAADIRLDGKSIVWNMLDVHLPIVCAVTGHAMGLGASIALLADITVMSDTARLGDPHVKVGIVAGDGGTVAWPLAVGPQLAKRYLLTGDPVTAADAEKMGLIVESASDPEACVAAGLAWAKRLADGDVPAPVCDKTAAALAALEQPGLLVTPSTWHYNGGGCC